MTPQQSKLKYYTTPQGLYVKFPSPHKDYRINGILPKPTFSRDWIFIEGEQSIDVVEILVSESRSNQRAELKNPALESDQIPSVITSDMVDGRWWDWDTDSDYSGISGLYEYKYDTIPAHYEPFKIDTEFLGQLDIKDAHSFSDMSVTVYRSSYKSEGDNTFTISSVASFSEFERMLCPEFALPLRPCKLTSKVTFDIVRRFVNDNINSRVAVVTSDYDFCFTVEKKIAIKPFERKREILNKRGKSYSPPRFNTQSITYTSRKVFEMTSEERKYGDYTPIKGFSGDSISDLVQNVKTFLEELMDEINAPVAQCSCCNGTGHELISLIDSNKR
jgi:hypothetical protein